VFYDKRIRRREGKQEMLGDHRKKLLSVWRGVSEAKGVEESNKWSNLAVMMGFILGYRLLCFLIQLYRSHRTRI